MRKTLAVLLVFLLCSAWVFSGEFTVVTMAIGDKYQKIVAPGIENKRKYCDRHGYDFVCGMECLDPDRPVSWSKVLLILKVMEESNSEWIFWTDADSLVMNYQITLDSLVDADYDFVITRDLNDINAGQFFLRNCQWSKDFLLGVYARTECIYDGLWENRAIIYELIDKPILLARTKIVSQKEFNSYPPQICRRIQQAQYESGDFIIHFPSIGGKLLINQFKKYSKQVLY